MTKRQVGQAALVVLFALVVARIFWELAKEFAE